MRSIAVSVSMSVLGLAMLAPAQTKISGTVQCGKPDEEHSLDVGDRPNHSLMISKGKCTWTKPMKIAGTQTKEDDGTNFDELDGDRTRGHGYVVGTMDNGDKMYVSIQSSGTMKDGKMQGSHGTFALTGGTGKLKGVKGKGTFKGTAAEDGTTSYDVVGVYQAAK
jgi:hypothetical protein